MYAVRTEKLFDISQTVIHSLRLGQRILCQITQSEGFRYF